MRAGPRRLPALSAGSTGPTAGSVVSRWLFFAGLLGAAGIALFALVARPRDEERIALTLASFAAVAAFGAAEEAHRAGFETRAGTALVAGFVAAVVVATLAGAATLERSVLRPALLLAVGLVAVPSFAGHALDRGLARVNVVADILHVTGAAAWVGALLGLVLFRDVPQRRTIQLAAGGVLLAGATGVVRACFELVQFSQLWDTSYGQTLLVKTGIAFAALGGGWVLRSRIRRRAGVELVLLAGLVVAVSVLVDLRPGRNVEAALVQRVEATQPTPAPPLPAPGAVVLAQQMGPLGVALQLEPKRTTAVVLSPAGAASAGSMSALAARTRMPAVTAVTESNPCLGDPFPWRCRGSARRCPSRSTCRPHRTRPTPSCVASRRAIARSGASSTSSASRRARRSGSRRCGRSSGRTASPTHPGRGRRGS